MWVCLNVNVCECVCMDGGCEFAKKALTSSFITLVSVFYRQIFFCFHFLKNLRRDYIAFVYSTYVFHDFFTIDKVYYVCLCFFLREKKTPPFLLVFLNFLFLRVITFI